MRSSNVQTPVGVRQQNMFQIFLGRPTTPTFDLPIQHLASLSQLQHEQGDIESITCYCRVTRLCQASSWVLVSAATVTAAPYTV